MVAHPYRQSAQTLGQAVGRVPSRGCAVCRSFALAVAPLTCDVMHTHVSEAFGPDPEGDGYA